MEGSAVNAVMRHLPLPPVSTTADGILRADRDRIDFLQKYATMSPSDTALEEMNAKLKWDIIRKYHEPISKLTKVKSGKYAGQWQTYMKGVDGKSPRKYKRFKTFNDAYSFIVQYYSIQAETLETYFPHWLEWKGKRNNNKKSTLTHNEIDFEKYVKGTALGKMPLTAITPEDLDEWARELLIKKPLNASRFNTYKIVVKGPLELAVREKIIPASPWRPEFMDYKVLLKSKRRAPSKEKIFYDDEIAAIIHSCMDAYEQTGNSTNIAIMVNFDLGLRVGELSALKWSDIDWKNQTIFIQRQESERKVEEYVKSDSSSGYRELPLNSQIIELLTRLRQDFGLKSEFVFCDAQGRRKTSSSIQKRLIYAQVGKNGDKASCGVKRIHCQRRTAATRIAKDMGLEVARIWLGHTDIQTTLRYIYSTESIESMRKYAEKSSFLASNCQNGQKIVTLSSS